MFIININHGNSIKMSLQYMWQYFTRHPPPSRHSPLVPR
jgi:hypothetical protein